MTTLPSAAVQLESVLRTMMTVLISPGTWLLDSWPSLLVATGMAAAAASLAFLLRRQIG